MSQMMYTCPGHLRVGSRLWRQECSTFNLKPAEENRGFWNKLLGEYAACEGVGPVHIVHQGMVS